MDQETRQENQVQDKETIIRYPRQQRDMTRHLETFRGRQRTTKKNTATSKRKAVNQVSVAEWISNARQVDALYKKLSVP